MKKLALTFIIIAVMLLGSSPVLASTESSRSNSIEAGIGVEALQLIQGWYSSIQNAGNNHVSIYGETLTYKVTDIVGVKFYLQYYNNSSWVTLDTVKDRFIYVRSSFPCIILGFPPHFPNPLN